MAQAKGSCDPAFQLVRDLFDTRISQGDELGASLCVNIDGKNIIDLWGGYTDTEKTRPWNDDTLTAVWSSSKVVTTLAATILIDRGLLNAEEKVSKYWPEFAANGKEGVTVAHVLSHASGLPSWEAPMTLDEIYDTEAATRKIAEQAPWWTPGEKSGYHMINQGHIVGELVRRLTGKSLKRFIAEEIAGPLGADFRLGVEEKDWYRTADIIPPAYHPTDGLSPDSVLVRAMAGAPITAEASMTPGFRGAEIGAANGFGNARALCRIGSVVSLGGSVDGKKYLSPGTIDKMLQEQISGPDLILGVHVRFGLGVGLPVPDTVPWIRDGRLCFWGGWGGSLIIMDLDRRMTIGYAMNKMAMGNLGNENSEAYVKAIYAAFDMQGGSPSL